MLKLSNEVKNRFAAAALKTFDLSNFDGISSDEATKAMASELEELFDLNNPEVMAKRHDFFKIVNSKADDYREQVFQVDDGKSILAGIRHVGGNIERPFISLWPDFEIQSFEDLKAIHKAISAQFEMFSPTDLSFWLSPRSKFFAELEKKIKPSLRYFVASSKDIKALEKPNHYDRVSLLSVKDNSYRSWYEKLYSDFHSKNEELKDWVPLNDKEDMDDCLKDNLLFFIDIDGKRAGIIAGKKENLLGKPGIYFTEILLSSDFKRKGLAATVQRKFIDMLTDDIDLVWGTIYSKNIASTKTALRVGRLPVRNEYFLPISFLK